VKRRGGERGGREANEGDRVPVSTNRADPPPPPGVSSADCSGAERPSVRGRRRRAEWWAFCFWAGAYTGRQHGPSGHWPTSAHHSRGKRPLGHTGTD
jgi:hypothetical protein